MRVTESVRWFLSIPFYPGIPFSDRARLAYYYLKSLLNRFILKAKPSNRRLNISYAGEPLYFRDNWFDPRSVYTVFSNDYTSLDKGIFTGLGTFIDVGANAGLISRCVRHASPNCRIICFEPLQENAELCRLNNPHAVVEACGVGSSNGMKELLVDGSAFMASSIGFDYSQSKRAVPTTTLDSYLKKPRAIDLLKIDVEGMEVEVLAGAKRALPEVRRVIAEVHSNALMKGVSTAMKGSGFEESRTISIGKETYITNWRNARFKPR